MKNPVIYIILNGELKMSPGKAAAQAVHAAMMLSANSKKEFLSDYKRTVVVLEAKNANQIKNLYAYLEDTDLDCDYYIDEGVNEVDAYSVTALAVGLIESTDEETRSMFSQFPLFTGNLTIRREDQFGYTREKAIIPATVSTYSNRIFKILKRLSK